MPSIKRFRTRKDPDERRARGLVKPRGLTCREPGRASTNATLAKLCGGLLSFVAVVAVAVSVAVAYGVVFAGTARAAEVAAFEAENMTPDSSTIKPSSDDGANNGTALRYAANGSATKEVNLSEVADRVVVRARNARNATNAVCVRIRLDGAPVAPDQCLGRKASTYRNIVFSGVNVPSGDAARVAVNALEVGGKDALFVDAVRLYSPTLKTLATTEQACNLNQRIANAAAGQVIDGGGCVERSYVELRKRLTLKNITVKGTDDWTGKFSPSGGNHRSTLTVPEFVEPQQTSDPMNTALCEPQDAAMLCGEAEMVFLDGRYLSQRPNGADPGPGEFALDAGRRVVLGEDPAGKRVEVATRQRGLQLASGSGGTVLENVDVTQVANTIGKSGTGAALGNGGNALTVRNSEVSWTHGSGFQCGGGVRCEVAYSEFHHAGESGMTSYNASPLLFENNTVRDNCSQTGLPDVAYNDSFVCSGLKITGESPAGRVVAGNVFHHNDHAGVWTDVRANNTKIVRNRIHHNEEQGIHVEISNGIEIHGNVLYENGWVGTQSSASNSAGIYMNTSARISIHDNIMAWNRDGFAFIGNTRGEPTWPWGGSDIYANHIYQANYDQVATHMMNYWLLGDEVNFTGEIMHDNSYYYANQNDDSGTQVGSPVAETTQNRFRYVPTGALQGNHPPYRNLSTFRVDTPVEGGTSGYVTRATATSTLTGAGVPTNTQH